MGERTDKASPAFFEPFCFFVRTDGGSVAQGVGRLFGVKEGSGAGQQAAQSEGQGGEHLTAGGANMVDVELEGKVRAVVSSVIIGRICISHSAFACCVWRLHQGLVLISSLVAVGSRQWAVGSRPLCGWMRGYTSSQFWHQA